MRFIEVFFMSGFSVSMNSVDKYCGERLHMKLHK